MQGILLVRKWDSGGARNHYRQNVEVLTSCPFWVFLDTSPHAGGGGWGGHGGAKQLGDDKKGSSELLRYSAEATRVTEGGMGCGTGKLRERTPRDGGGKTFSLHKGGGKKKGASNSAVLSKEQGKKLDWKNQKQKKQFFFNEPWSGEAPEGEKVS